MKTFLILIFTTNIFVLSAFAGGEDPVDKSKVLIPELNTIKTGLLIGYQLGQFQGFELGMERQWKEIKLKKPFTFAISATGEYQVEANILGFKAGPWFKAGRADFTYGVQFVAFSDFIDTRIGIDPNIGFKIIGFHVIAGYNILVDESLFTEYNRLHLSIRYYISKDREFKWIKKKKKKD